MPPRCGFRRASMKRNADGSRSKQPVTVQLNAIPDRQFTGHIEQIGAIASMDFSSGWPITRNFILEIVLDQTDPRFKPGITGQVTVIVDRVPDALTIPAQAMFQKSGQNVAYVWRGSQFEERAIEVGRRSGDKIMVAKGVERRRPSGAERSDRRKSRWSSMMRSRRAITWAVVAVVLCAVVGVVAAVRRGCARSHRRRHSHGTSETRRSRHEGLRHRRIAREPFGDADGASDWRRRAADHAFAAHRAPPSRRAIW